MGDSANLKQFTFYFVNGGRYSVTGHFMASDDEYIITDQLGAEHRFPKGQVLRYVSAARRR
jgi:hypothetical protein